MGRFFWKTKPADGGIAPLRSRQPSLSRPWLTYGPPRPQPKPLLLPRGISREGVVRGKGRRISTFGELFDTVDATKQLVVAMLDASNPLTDDAMLFPAKLPTEATVSLAGWPSATFSWDFSADTVLNGVTVRIGPVRVYEPFVLPVIIDKGDTFSFTVTMQLTVPMDATRAGL